MCSVGDLRPREMYSTVPIIHFRPVKDYKRSEAEYAAPIYKTSTRAGTRSVAGMGVRCASHQLCVGSNWGVSAAGVWAFSNIGLCAVFHVN